MGKKKWTKGKEKSKTGVKSPLKAYSWRRGAKIRLGYKKGEGGRHENHPIPTEKKHSVIKGNEKRQLRGPPGQSREGLPKGSFELTDCSRTLDIEKRGTGVKPRRKRKRLGERKTILRRAEIRSVRQSCGGTGNTGEANAKRALEVTDRCRGLKFPTALQMNVLRGETALHIDEW